MIRRSGPAPILRDLLAPASVVLAGLATALWWAFGPRPSHPAASDALYSTAAAFVEPSDRGVLVTWWVTALALAVLGGVVGPSIRRRRMPGIPAVALAALATIVLSVALFADLDRFGFFPGITGLQAVIGACLATLIAWIAADSRPPAQAVTAFTAVLGSAALIALLVQLPSTVRDPVDFQYVAGELSAVASGRLPLVDFSAQYANLIPYLVAPAVLVASSHPAAAVLGCILGMQVLTVAAGAVIVGFAAGRSFVVPAVALMSVPLVATTGAGVDSASYFQTFPLRLVGPMLTFALIVVLLRRPSRPLVRASIEAIVGVCAGVTALNNLDFGVPAAVACLVVLALGRRHATGALLSLITGLAGAVVAVLVCCGLIALIGGGFDASRLLTFVRIFGATGYFAEPMAPIGFHVALAALFITASVLGFWLLRTSARLDRWTAARTRGLALAGIGGWSLLSLVYAAGRSLQPTYVSGFALQAGVLLALLLPDALRALHALRRTGDVRQAAVRLPLMAVAIVAVMSSAALVPAAPQRGVGAVPIIDVRASAAREGSATAISALETGRVVQALPDSGLLDLTYGVPSAAIASDPAYAVLSPSLTRDQCGARLPRSARWLLVRDDLAAVMKDDGVCRSRFDLGAAVRFGGLSMLPLRAAPR